MSPATQSPSHQSSSTTVCPEVLALVNRKISELKHGNNREGLIDVYIYLFFSHFYIMSTHIFQQMIDNNDYSASVTHHADVYVDKMIEHNNDYQREQSTSNSIEWQSTAYDFNQPSMSFVQQHQSSESYDWHYSNNLLPTTIDDQQNSFLNNNNESNMIDEYFDL